MMGVKEIRFDSEKKTLSSSTFYTYLLDVYKYFSIDLACGFVSTTDITFVNEGIIARVTAGGNIEFFDCERKLLASICVPADNGGRGHYEDIYCKIENDTIKMKFPVYEWEDYYPHCDGEHDRWVAHVKGYKPPITFCITTHDISISESDE